MLEGTGMVVEPAPMRIGEPDRIRVSLHCAELSCAVELLPDEIARLLRAVVAARDSRFTTVIKSRTEV